MSAATTAVIIAAAALANNAARIRRENNIKECKVNYVAEKCDYNCTSTDYAKIKNTSWIRADYYYTTTNNCIVTPSIEWQQNGVRPEVEFNLVFLGVLLVIGIMAFINRDRS